MYFCQMITITLIRTHLGPDSKFEGGSLMATEAAFLTHLCTLCTLYRIHKSQGIVTRNRKKTFLLVLVTIR